MEITGVYRFDFVSISVLISCVGYQTKVAEIATRKAVDSPSAAAPLNWM
jgi:hypothetical protein